MGSDCETQIELHEDLSASMKEFLAGALEKAQDGGSRSNLSNRRPQEWVDIATGLLSGRSRTSMRSDHGGSHSAYSINRVHAELMATEGVEKIRREFATRCIEGTFSMLEMRDEAAKKYMEQLEEGTAKVDLNGIAAINKSISQSMGDWNRLSGGATYVVEQRLVTDKDLNELKDNLFRDMKRSEAINLEDNDDD